MNQIYKWEQLEPINQQLSRFSFKPFKSLIKDLHDLHKISSPLYDEMIVLMDFPFLLCRSPKDPKIKAKIHPSASPIERANYARLLPSSKHAVNGQPSD